MLRFLALLLLVHSVPFILFSQDSLLTDIPTDVLLKEPTQSNFCISHDGKYMAEIVETNNKSDIVIIDIDGYTLFNRISLDEEEVQGLYWLTSKRLMYESYGEIFAIDIDGSNGAVIVNRLPDKVVTDWYRLYKNFRYNNILNFLADRKDEILIETYDYKGYASVKRVNIFTSESYVILSGSKHKMNKWITNAKGDVKLGIKYDEEGIHYYQLDKVKELWVPLEIKIDNQVFPLTINAASYLNQNLNFEGFGYQDDIIYLSSNINSDRRRLIKYDLANNKSLGVVLEDVNCDVSDPHGEDVQLIFDPKSRSLAGARYEGIMPEFKWYSEEYKNVHDYLNGKYRHLIHDIIDMDPNNSRFLIYQWSDNYAGNIGVFTVSDSSYAVMHQINEELNKFELSKTKNIIVPTRDDHKIPAYMNLPPDYKDGQELPLVVIPHGGPWARDYWQPDHIVQYFATKGYAVLRVNFRGSTGLGKEHVLSGLEGINTVMINDIADGVQHVKDKFAIDPANVFIYGHSYGGYAVYMSLLRYADLYTSGVAVSAPSDIRAWMKTQKKNDNDFAYEFWDKALGEKNNKYLSEISPIYYAEDLNKPLLVMHGKRDEIIPVEQAENMVEKLKDHNKEVTLKVFQNESHSFSDSNSLGYLLDLADEFFKTDGITGDDSGE